MYKLNWMLNEDELHEVDRTPKIKPLLTADMLREVLTPDFPIVYVPKLTDKQKSARAIANRRPRFARMQHA